MKTNPTDKWSVILPGLLGAMRGALAAWLLFPVLIFPGDVHADVQADASSAVQYTSAKASPDGIGKLYQGREIAQVMGYHGAAWLERANREKEEQPDRVIATLNLKPGMTVADIGAGSGYYTWRIAQRVGARGKVYAVDVQPEMIELLNHQMKKRGVENVRSILSTASDPRLPAGSVDLALMVDVYHELEFPYEMLGAIVSTLKPGGRLALVEFRGGDSRIPIKPLHTMTEAQVRRELDLFPLEWVATERNLPWQHVIVFRKK